MPKTKKHKKKNPVAHAWRSWPFKHMTAFTLLIVAFILLLDTAIMSAFFEWSRQLGYVGAMVAGMLSVSIFTAPAGVIILFELGQVLNPLYVIAFGTLGSIIADTMILRFFEDNIVDELRLLGKKTGIGFRIRRGQQKRFRLASSLIGLFIVSSPLPDEAGIALMDVSHLSQTKIISICAVANLIGVSALVLAGYWAA